MDKSVKEIIVLSGKGGTGKTSITGSFAALEGNNLVLADCDVDAADMHLLTEPVTEMEDDFFSGKLASIRPMDCTRCNKCKKACHFDAINITDGIFSVDPIACEGCSYCYHVCPSGAIDMKPRKAGKFYISQTRFNNYMVHARLGIAADNSGKLVTKVREEAKDIADEERVEYLLVDGSPGIGCPVVASLTGADFAVLVTEPTVSGIHDLSRVFELIEKLKIKTGCIINKADINPEKAEELKRFLNSKNIPVIAEFPYDESFTAAITQGKTIVEWDNGILKDFVTQSWETVKKLINS
ncbi:MAG: ATP-binding protein [Bacteroidales bacterium]|nr:ATP-binding protein [Bacteroidales bacterium]